MAFVRLIGKDYYVCVARNRSDYLKKGTACKFKDYFKVIASVGRHSQSITIKTIFFPEKFFGKKIRLKVEVM